MQEEKKEFRPKRQDNIINVSGNRKANFFLNIGRGVLNDHETIEMHAIGNAISICAIAAQHLVEYLIRSLTLIQI